MTRSHLKYVVLRLPNLLSDPSQASEKRWHTAHSGNPSFKCIDQT
jgi:hypothetical protein